MEHNRGGGAKLNRSEVVYVRLDPMVHQGAQLAAARERRTLSSFVECAVEERIRTISSGIAGRSIWSVLEEIWHPESAIRFARLALYYPHLLSHSELRLWELVCHHAYFWVGEWNAQYQWCWYCMPQNLLADRLIEYWPILTRIMAGELDESAIPSVQHRSWEPVASAASVSGMYPPAPAPNGGTQPGAPYELAGRPATEPLAGAYERVTHARTFRTRDAETPHPPSAPSGKKPRR